MYYFVYHINTIALYWQEKSTLLLNESCRLLLSAARNAITKATEYVNFSFSFRILVFLPFWQSLNVTVCKRYGFFSVLAAILRTNPDKRPWIENGESFAVHSSLAEWRERQQTHQLLIGDIKHSWKKNTRYIFTSVVATLLRAFHINHSLYEKSHLSRGKIELRNGIACSLGQPYICVILSNLNLFMRIYQCVFLLRGLGSELRDLQRFTTTTKLVRHIEEIVR